MKYSELVYFEPIETVIQINEANTETTAIKLVKTFVISERLAEQLIDIVFPQLQFDNPQDNKGLLIIGNYGTGKSHLMSVITALAEYPDMYREATHNSVANKTKELISGRFKVFRVEIGSTTQSFRDIICSELERQLAEINIIFKFPKASEITNNKDFIVAMMSEFLKKYPDHGLILAVDELLDYLRSRDDQELILDLNFLREIGEVCRLTRFRFIAGLQESLFANPRFQFQAATIRKVKDRFELISIAREDIEYVVAERLLKKDKKQKIKIIKHLDKFNKLYTNFAEQQNVFVKLFPVHPAYIKTFEHVFIAEKREVLKTISAEIKKMLNMDVPDDEPGLLTYDSYWQILKGNPSFRTDPDIKEVISASDVLENKVQQSMTKKLYIPMAIRIIHAISVHRLTTGDIYNQIGVTVEELRDNLCLYIKLPPDVDGDFLKSTIESVLREISKTVSGSYISQNIENSQYYLDLKKSTDYDSLILQRGESLDKNKLDRYFFDALTKVMECVDVTYVTGFKIWEHELEWVNNMVTRKGYLFFGAPNERSTAQPPRDFYIYFLELFDPPKFKDEKKSDEVLFVLANPKKELIDAIKTYAGTKELAATVSSGNKSVYEDKAVKQVQVITKWLKENFNTAFEVTYKGVTKKMLEWTKAGATTSIAQSFREHADHVSSFCLSPHFDELTPEYPKFSILVTDSNRREYASEALRWIKGGQKTRQGTAILDALQLLNGEYLDPEKSKYAKYMLTLLRKKGDGQVVNRNEIISDAYGVEYDKEYRLEPEWIIVILASLAHHGDIIISYPGKNIDASNLDQFMKLQIDEAINFKHIGRPKDVPVATLVKLFDILEIPSGLIRNSENRENAVKQLQVKVDELLHQIVPLEKNLQTNILGFTLLTDRDVTDYRKTLNEFKDFLEHLQSYDTPGKLKNFQYSLEQVKSQKIAVDRVKMLQEFTVKVQEISPLFAYLSAAESIMPRDHPWVNQLDEIRSKIIIDLQNTNIQNDPAEKTAILRKLIVLKNSYIEEYLKMHGKSRLDRLGDTKKSRLLKDVKFAKLSKLASVELLPIAQIIDFQDRLGRFKSCFSLISKDLEDSFFCLHCNFRPLGEPKIVANINTLITNLDEELEQIEIRWKQTLIDNLNDPAVQVKFSLLSSKKKILLEDFIKKQELPEEIDIEFIQTLQEVFSGLEKAEIKIEDLKNALTNGGTPCTLEELNNRFKLFLVTILKDKDPKNIRIVLT